MTPGPITAALQRFAKRFATGRPVGARGERIAARYLKKQGHRILGQNLRNRFGEVDLLTLAPDGKTAVIVEVKTAASDGRSSHPFSPQLRVNRRKQKRLIALAAQLARKHRLTRHRLRFDIIAVHLNAPPDQQVEHIEAAFDSHV